MTESENDPLLEKCLEELQVKTLIQIQEETALVWATRARAALILGTTSWKESGGMTPEAALLLRDAVEYEHEAIEHAALTGKIEFLVGIIAMLQAAKERAAA